MAKKRPSEISTDVYENKRVIGFVQKLMKSNGLIENPQKLQRHKGGQNGDSCQRISHQGLVIHAGPDLCPCYAPVQGEVGAAHSTLGTFPDTSLVAIMALDFSVVWRGEAVARGSSPQALSTHVRLTLV
jgi:hypothetical protein